MMFQEEEGAFLQPQSCLAPYLIVFKWSSTPFLPGRYEFASVILTPTIEDSNISQDWVQQANCQNKQKTTWITFQKKMYFHDSQVRAEVSARIGVRVTE